MIGLVHRALSDAARTAFRDPRSYFHRYAGFPTRRRATAIAIWERINLVNLEEISCRPDRARPDPEERRGPCGRDRSAAAAVAYSKSHVVPAKTRTHNHRFIVMLGSGSSFRRYTRLWLWVPAFAGTTMKLFCRSCRDMPRGGQATQGSVEGDFRDRARSVSVRSVTSRPITVLEQGETALEPDGTRIS